MRRTPLGDKSTHLIFYSGYWHLVSLEHHIGGSWWMDKQYEKVCKDGEEEKVFALEDLGN